MDISTLHRLIQAYKALPNMDKVNVGNFINEGVPYGIRIIKRRFNSEYSQELEFGAIQIEMPSLSGKLYVPIMDFRVNHPSKFKSVSPILNIDPHWIGIQFSQECIEEFTDNVIVLANTRFEGKSITFELSGTEEECFDTLESSLFQHNVSCPENEVLDSDIVLSRFNLGNQYIKSTLGFEGECVNSLEIMTPTLTVRRGYDMILPYDEIAEVLENFVSQN
ncbi:hypothetical protein AAGG91_002830 [Salmonella enterica]